MSTLANRVTEAIDESGAKVTKIAQRCGISPQAVYDWKSGESKSIDGANLVILAEMTGYNARWIARGEGAKKGLSPEQAYVVNAMDELGEKGRRHIVKAVEAIYEVEREKEPNPPTRR